jgi:magnesium transporter
MIKFFNGRLHKVGLPPGTIIYADDKSLSPFKLEIFHYDKDDLEEKITTDVNEALALIGQDKVTWINIEGRQNPEEIEKLCSFLNIHALTIEDILTPGQRPKIEDNVEYLFLVIKILSFTKEDSLATEQVSLLLGDKYVISFHEQSGATLDIIKNRIRQSKGRIRNKNADYLFYALIDAIVDYYFVVLEKIGDKLEDIEDDLLENPSMDTLNALHRMKKEVITLRRAVWPLREVVNKLERRDLKLLGHETNIFFRDVYDHTIQVIETVETFRDMISGMIDLYQSTTSNRLNQVMKALTIIATIFLPLTFLTGLYGMNFDYMPELQWHYGYFAVWGLSITVVATMLVIFRRKRWL